ncbi:peptidoglycan D,D-transpeptidase FtsI family protein [Paenactinomyces guangxiensis]|uniref:Penicillin-binding protein 2 n=1 Tax=Paenactinomyces guangxiensis TaxID=1490290 RepID=A0A7W2A6Z1_9BACL|nr:penicillin-binding protein 2 [Paenactinomyces guangxiensis]MBA4493025.1 penicillin-binding protein 2 [Paenactinomyces guangxiensis]MBH8590126.1 penicillin-binding protein 2 [Paenactinomyces guangxiensis]
MSKKWRGWMIAFAFMAAFLCILARLFMIQVISTRSFSKEQIDLIKLAQFYQDREVVIDSGRGTILDRKGRSLAGEKNWSLLAFPQSEQQFQLRKSQFERLAKQIGYSPERLRKQLNDLYRPSILPDADGDELLLTPADKERIESLQIPGVFVVESDYRMTLNQLGQQVIGRVVKNTIGATKSDHTHIGATGLEAAFEPFLHGEEESVLMYTRDRSGKPLNGVQVKIKQQPNASENPPHMIKTALDKEIQRRVEKILAEEQVEEGAVVVQEIATGNILAMASRPKGYSPVGELNPWDNRALMEATPGSIFKTVVAIAALDQGIVKPDTEFDCNGELGRYGLKDDQEHGHGKQTFAEAYANSCNVVLGQVAEKLGGEKLESYAKRLGLAREIIWSGQVFKEKHFSQIPQEQTGLVFAPETSKKDPGAVVQAGIGQRDVKMTPVQATNLVTTLFHGGKPIHPRLVTEIQDVNGRPVFKFVNKYLSGAAPIKESTLKAVQQMMRSVVTDGTAVSVSKAEWPLAGKTGTAQVGVDKRFYHKWMIGYGPAERPRYSAAVVVRSVSDSDDPRAKRIFQRVMDEIARLEKEENKKKEKREKKEHQINRPKAGEKVLQKKKNARQR